MATENYFMSFFLFFSVFLAGFVWNGGGQNAIADEFRQVWFRVYNVSIVV